MSGNKPFTIRIHIIRRVFGGLLFLLPTLLTLYLFYQIYFILNEWMFDPFARFLLPKGIDSPYWPQLEGVVIPILSLGSMFILLYVCGWLFQTRLEKVIDWIFSKIPGVSTIYKAIDDILSALQGPDGIRSVDQVVLAPFPHGEARMAGYLMGTSEDEESGEKLACVYIPIALFPPSGYTLIFPEKDVIYTDWEPKETWKLLLSGGLTLPERVPYRMRLMDSKDEKTTNE